MHAQMSCIGVTEETEKHWFLEKLHVRFPAPLFSKFEIIPHTQVTFPVFCFRPSLASTPRLKSRFDFQYSKPRQEHKQLVKEKNMRKKMKRHARKIGPSFDPDIFVYIREQCMTQAVTGTNFKAVQKAAGPGEMLDKTQK
jgi:hypothetical protein